MLKKKFWKNFFKKKLNSEKMKKNYTKFFLCNFSRFEKTLKII